MAANETLVRSVFVDDEDSRITYTGPWTTFQEDFAVYTDYGPTYQGSQHRLLGGTGSLTFTFRGTAGIRIYGTTNVRNSSGTFDPSHTCEVDGVAIKPTEPWSRPLNGWTLCIANLTYSGEHTITLNAVSGERAFYVDLIEYIPDRTIPPIDPTVVINDNDLAVRYFEGAWKSTTGTGMLTQEAGAKMSVSFTGTSAKWIGAVPIDYPRGASKATYSLDGSDPIEFDVPGLPSGGQARFGQAFFELRDLDPGGHELIVTHGGPAAPLVFDYLLVENGDIFMTTSPGGGGHTETKPGENEPAGSPTPSAVRGKKTPVGAIAGGVVGGVVIIAALIALLLILKRKKRNNRARMESAAVVQHFHSPSEPQPSLPTTHEVAPLLAHKQSSPTVNSTNLKGNTSAQGDPMLDHNAPAMLSQPPMVYHGQHPHPSYSSGQAYNSTFNPQPNSNANSLVQPTMRVTLQPNRASYPNRPEPMA